MVIDKDNLEHRIQDIQRQLIEIKTAQRASATMFKYYTYSAKINAADRNIFRIQRATITFTPIDPSKDYLVIAFDSSDPSYGSVGINSHIVQNQWKRDRLAGDTDIVIVSTTPGAVSVTY